MNGTADHLPLADGAAAAVTVAQAFHWFAHDEALAEFQRVVGPGGRLAIVYNRRDLDSRCSGAWRRSSAATAATACRASAPAAGAR